MLDVIIAYLIRNLKFAISIRRKSESLLVLKIPNIFKINILWILLGYHSTEESLSFKKAICPAEMRTLITKIRTSALTHLWFMINTYFRQRQKFRTRRPLFLQKGSGLPSEIERHLWSFDLMFSDDLFGEDLWDYAWLSSVEIYKIGIVVPIPTNRQYLCPPPSKKEGHIALHMSVYLSVGPSVSRYVGLP